MQQECMVNETHFAALPGVRGCVPAVSLTVSVSTNCSIAVSSEVANVAATRPRVCMVS